MVLFECFPFSVIFRAVYRNFAMSFGNTKEFWDENSSCMPLQTPSTPPFSVFYSLHSVSIFVFLLFSQTSMQTS